MNKGPKVNTLFAQIFNAKRAEFGNLAQYIMKGAFLSMHPQIAASINYSSMSFI